MAVGVPMIAGSVGYATLLTSYAAEFAEQGWPWRNAHVIGIAGYAAMLSYLVVKMAAPKAKDAQKYIKYAGAGLLLSFLVLQALGFALHKPRAHDAFGVAGLALMLVPGQARLAAAFMTAYYALSAFEHCGDAAEQGQCIGRAALVPYYLDLAMDPATH